MEREIKFKEKEIQELITVLQLCQPEIGYIGDHLYRTIISYFRKQYQTELGFTEIFTGKRLISADKCIVHAENNISTAQIIEELINLSLLEEVKVHVDDKYGNKAYHKNNNIPIKRSFYRIIKK